MNKPYIICHMISTIDGRIDCPVMEHLPGVAEYDSALKGLDADASVTGRVTARLEMALPGTFTALSGTPYGRTGFHKKGSGPYTIVVDTEGTLLWNPAPDGQALLILTSENVDTAYLDYLDSLHISWIAAGSGSLDLKKACEILAGKFQIRRMTITGGGHINAGFLAEGLIDEISLLLGAGIDGHGGMTSLFDGLPMDMPLTLLKLESVEQFADGGVWLRYLVKKGD
jgi:2,5-diamino-6-(ribosylamino)-4(3H)-pyrimidinone 5'-phosphate reductase